PRVPADLGVVMRMEVDEAGGDDQPLGINHLVGDAVWPAADLGDSPILDPHVTPEARHPRAIYNRSTLDVDVILGHVHPRLGVVSQFPPDTGIKLSSECTTRRSQAPPCPASHP